MELCLRSGAKISTQQHDLSTPIHLACSQGAIEIVKLMFQVSFKNNINRELVSANKIDVRTYNS